MLNTSILNFDFKSYELELVDWKKILLIWQNWIWWGYQYWTNLRHQSPIVNCRTTVQLKERQMRFYATQWDKKLHSTLAGCHQTGTTPNWFSIKHILRIFYSFLNAFSKQPFWTIFFDVWKGMCSSEPGSQMSVFAKIFGQHFVSGIPKVIFSTDN